MYQYLGDTEINLYDLLGFFSFIAVLIFNFSQFKEKKLILGKISKALIKSNKTLDNNNRYKNLIVSLEIYIVSTFQYSFTAYINSAFGDLFGTGKNYYGLLFITPLLIVFICFLLGIDIFKQMDLITPAFPLALIVLKIACFCQGCCGGIESSSGLYNHSSNLVEFPVQLVEAGCALFIFAILMLLRKKIKEGTFFPLYLIIYSTMRFFSEFLRCEPDIIWILKKYHLFCLSGIIIGLLELFIVKYKDKIMLLVDRFYEFIKKRLYKYAVKNGIIREKNIVHHKKRRK